MSRDLLTLGETLSAQARLMPDRLGIRDLERSMTFGVWNQRACRLANGLLGLGLRKGDRVAVLAYNCIEWAEIYAATAKAGLIAVPVNFRLVAPEVRYIIDNAECAALIVQDELAGVIEEIRGGLPFSEHRIVHFGARSAPAGWCDYEALLASASDREPASNVTAIDPWMFMYTSGTTGAPKGAIRSHKGNTLVALVTEIELGIRRGEGAMLVMPMCHANSLYFFSSFNLTGGPVTIYSRKSFDPEHALRALSESGANFTSLVPTHYIMLLSLPAAVRARYACDQVNKLMISSAPARPDTKRAVMEMFRNSGLFELYGSTEGGWVTMLHPHEQFTKLGSVGRECVGSAPIRLLDDNGVEVPDGDAGELFHSNPYTFDGYWKMPEKTAEAFRDTFPGAPDAHLHPRYCTVGDMARRDVDGYIWLVDRKKNMIISGGENVYPTEVENALGSHPAVKDVAVVGVPDDKWGERVHGVVVLHAGMRASEDELIAWAKDKLAGYKRPRSISFIGDADMPRTATGKIQHRILRERFGG